MGKIRAFIFLGRDALKHLLVNDPLRMAGATAFFTTFALPPILLLLVQVFKWIVGLQTMRHQLYIKLLALFGKEAVGQIVNVLQAIHKLASNTFITVGGFIFLLFVITTLFKVFKNSINQLWEIKPLKRANFISTLRSRTQALIVVLIAGILFIAGFAAETLQTIIGGYFVQVSEGLSHFLNMAINHIISIVIVTCWFTIVFRYLPDGRPAWRVAWMGGFITSLLFAVGKVVMHALLTYSNINNVYGTSASIVLLLLFVFYSALILYFGASFTWMWAAYCKCPIEPLPHATHYKLIATDRDGNEV